MSCKIDTKETFEIIRPQSAHIDSKMAVDVQNFCNNAQNNDKSVILDLGETGNAAQEFSLMLEKVHNDLYAGGYSFAICNMPASIRSQLAGNAGEQLNIVPTLAEAIDLVSMEGLERELLGEDL